jgi:regulator of cell morphogenesis and NO signaling
MDATQLSQQTVAGLVAQNYRTAEVFKKHGIDFCCGGKKSITQACADKHVDTGVLAAELTAVQNKPADNTQNYNTWDLTFLSDYIVNVHHAYINSNLPLITGFADKVARVHGHHNTETVTIYQLWKQIADELTVHMKKEELVLFPYIRNLEKRAKEQLKTVPEGPVTTAQNPIRVMEQEHEHVGNLMQQIRGLSNNFTPPVYACNTYKVLYAKLNEFEEDLYRHVHLENNILFPKALQLEKESFK